MYTIPLVPEVCMGEKSTPYNRLGIFSIEKKKTVSCRQKLSDNVKVKTGKIYLIVLCERNNFSQHLQKQSCFCARDSLSYFMEETSQVSDSRVARNGLLQRWTLGNTFPRKKTEVFQVILQYWWAKMRQNYVLQSHSLTFFVML